MNRARLEDMALLMDIVQKQIDKAGSRYAPGNGMGFDLGTWKSDSGNGCGTTACAIGWAAEVKLIPGLEMRSDLPAYVTPSGATLRTWEAVEVAFDISNTRALELFSRTRYSYGFAGPSDVAARIRKLLAQA